MLRPSEQTVIQEQKLGGSGKMFIQDHTERDKASNKVTKSGMNRDSTFKKKYRPTEMNFDDMQMSIHEQDEAQEILSEMRDHVGVIDDESEVQSIKTFIKTATSGEIAPRNYKGRVITGEHFRKFS